MSEVLTIRGPVDSGSLGWTLSHEHLTTGGAGMQSFPWIYDVDDALKASLDALNRAAAAGINSMIDLTTFDLGRQVSLFEKIAEADTGVNIICATGVYRWVPMYFSHERQMRSPSISCGNSGTACRAARSDPASSRSPGIRSTGSVTARKDSRSARAWSASPGPRPGRLSLNPPAFSVFSACVNAKGAL
jgi:hypothetical protein